MPLITIRRRIDGVFPFIQWVDLNSRHGSLAAFGSNWHFSGSRGAAGGQPFWQQKPAIWQRMAALWQSEGIKLASCGGRSFRILFDQTAASRPAGRGPPARSRADGLRFVLNGEKDRAR
jgi:hypothetical protein